MNELNKITYYGSAAIIGRSNVGKSTLLNRFLSHKISITSHKPQTTRQHIIGIHTKNLYQVICLDTPGLNFQKNNKNINYLMNRIALNTLGEVTVIIFVIEGTYWAPDDKIIIDKLRYLKCPIILAINKIDLLKDKKHLLPYIKFLTKQMDFYDIVPICAKNGINVNIILDNIYKNLPLSTHSFPSNQITNCSQTFMISEIIREKVIHFLNNELPYSISIQIEQFYVNKNFIYNVHSSIIVNCSRRKKIVIGNKGEKIKMISIRARKDIESFLKAQVYLKLWVKIKANVINK